MEKYQPTIGLEIHAELKTQTKMFCDCSNDPLERRPNVNVCPVCLAHPGTLPVPNKKAIEAVIKVGLALSGEVTPVSKFDRKNYFYPDLPKGYQISQYDQPIISGGKLHNVRIRRIHLEEDTGRLQHATSDMGQGTSLVDFNRAGVPLMELVTEPDVRSAEEAVRFAKELQLVLRYLGVSDADMEKGQMRVEANISLDMGTKVEVKNLNSFRAVGDAIEYETKRQRELLEKAEKIVQETRGWDEARRRTVHQRLKEEAHDYRYFPEPDIPTLALQELAEELSLSLPEMPAAKRTRFAEEYHLKPADARQVCEDPTLSAFTERVFSELFAWLNALPEFDEAQEEQWVKEKQKLARLVSTWLVTKLPGLLTERNEDIASMKLTAENFAEFLKLIFTGKLSSNAGRTVLSEMLANGADPSHVMEEKQLGRMRDGAELSGIVDRMLASHPEEVERYRAGEKKLLQFFLGQIMKETEGTADAAASKNILLVKLESK